MSHERRPGKTLSLRWRETRIREATVSYDECRETFGLAGTPDRLLSRRVTAIIQYDSTELAAFSGHAMPHGRARYELTAVDGITLAEQDQLDVLTDPDRDDLPGL